MTRKKPSKRGAKALAKNHLNKSKGVYLKNVWLMGDVTPTYADNLIVRFQDGVFHMMFFQQQVPALVGTHAEMAQQLKETGVMENLCVGRLVVSQPKMAAMIESLQVSYEACLEHARRQEATNSPNGAQ